MAWWETGLLSEADWDGADWIGGQPARLPFDLHGASWIWYPEGNPAQSAPVGTRWLRRTFHLPATGAITSARMALTADDQYDLYVNGQLVAASPRVGDSWRQAQVIDLADRLREGVNTLAIEAVNTSATPAGVLGRLHVERSGAETFELVTDGSWKASDAAPPGWELPEFDDSTWPGAAVAAPYGEGPWGTSVGAAPRPSPLLRKEFAIGAGIQRARVYVSGLGYYVLTIDGQRVGTNVLDPGFTVYDETALYTTYDVTPALRE